MKKIFTSVLALFIASASFAQVTVTFRVDVTNFIAGGGVIDATGIRLTGNFSSRNATAGGAAMADFSPSIPSGAMTSLPNNIWQLAVTFPQASIGQSLNYLFVNGNFGSQEGTAASSTLISGNCGATTTVQGTPLVTRVLAAIPNTATTYAFCWDKCTASCNAGLNDVEITNVMVTPNPTSDIVVFGFESVSNEATISLFDLSGKEVLNQNVITESVNNIEISTANLNAGTYFYQIKSGDNITSGKLMKN